jgi:hypothetical protein
MDLPPISQSGPSPSDFDPNASALKRFEAIKLLAAKMVREEDPSKRETMLDQINQNLDETLMFLDPNPSRLEDVQLIRNTAHSACFGASQEARKIDYDFLCRSLDTLTVDL